MRSASEVTVRGRNLTIIESTSLSHLGSRWFGQTRWTLRDDETGQVYLASGKRLTGNSRLEPVDPI